MAKTSTRKLFLFGRYSLALLLPKKWLKEMEIENGDHVKLEFDRTRKRIVVRFTIDNNSPVLPNSSHSDKKRAKHSPKKDDETEDWQPIPQL